MPEGPEIHRVASHLTQALVGQGRCGVRIFYPPLAEAERALHGRLVSSVVSHGKALLIHFEHGHTLYSHNQLYGIWQIAANDEPPLPNRQLRIELRTAATARLYSATDIELWPTAALSDHPFLSRLGPDVLNPELSPSVLDARFEEPRFTNRTLQALYLDQSFIAGVGNYLRSEILFKARLDPTLRLGQLMPRSRKRLARITLDMAHRSRVHDGITRPPRAAQQAMRSGADYESARFWVFDRESLPCYECDTPIQRLTAAGRRLYLCPLCQSS